MKKREVCSSCKHFIGISLNLNRNSVFTFGGSNYVHCRKGYACDGFAYVTQKSYKNKGNYSMFESKDDIINHCEGCGKIKKTFSDGNGLCLCNSCMKKTNGTHLITVTIINTLTYKSESYEQELNNAFIKIPISIFEKIGVDIKSEFGARCVECVIEYEIKR